MIPLTAQAEYFQVNRSTIGKWLKLLAALKLVRVHYIIKINKTGKRRTFRSYPKAWAFKNFNNGILYGAEVHILRDDVLVGSGGRRRKGTNLPEPDDDVWEEE
jgi:hypothetical protein